MKKQFLLTSIAALSAGFLFSQTYIPSSKVSASDRDSIDRFGYSVDIDGDYMVVGAYRHDLDLFGGNNQSRAGAAYIFEKNSSGVWIEVQKIVASDRSTGDEFGYSVAIDGDQMVIGAQADDEDANGNNPIHNAGSAYIFERNSSGVWVEIQKIVAPDRAPDIVYNTGNPNPGAEDLSDRFGSSLTIWGDFLLVGAHHHDWNTTNTSSTWSSGSAYMFEKNASGVWTMVQKLNNSDREGWDRFGYAVSLDSNIAVISAYSEDEAADGMSNPLTNPGSVYIFERDTSGAWNEIQKIVPNDRNSGDHFGWDLSLSGNFLLIGCHSDDHDANDANLLDNAGSAYIFEKNAAGIWSQAQKLDASDRGMDDEMGISVALDGSEAIIGSFQHDLDAGGSNNITDAGAAYLFTNNVCNTPIATNQSAFVCYGQSFSVGDSSYTVSGSYIDTLAAINGCDSVVTTNLMVGPDLSTSTNIDICFGDSHTVGNNIYMFTGVYTDTLQGVDGCDSIIATNLTVAPTIDVTVSQTNNTIVSNANNATYQWIDCTNGNTPIAGETNQIFVAPVIGSYAVVVGTGNCADTSSCIFVSAIVGVDAIESSALINIKPNPSNGNVILTTDEALNAANLMVYDMTGKLLQTETYTGNEIQLNLSRLNAGTYVVRLIDRDNIYHKYLIID